MPTKPRPILPNPLGMSASTWGTVLCISLMLPTLGGCAKHKITGARTAHPDRVGIEDFVSPHDEQTTPRATEPPHLSAFEENHQNQDDIGEGLTLAAQRKAPAPIAELPPASSSPHRSSTRSLELLDAKVGDVNGKPIFTNSFFAPIEARLIAQAKQLPLASWRNEAGKAIANRLDGIIADELLRAEALTALTPTQRVGLQAFLGNFRTNLLSKNLGSSQLASRRIQQTEGITLDEALEQKELDTLVQLTLIAEVNRRVHVSWRDIKQRYERDIDQFSPPPTAALRVIRALSSDTEKVAEIQSKLDSGTDFLKIAAGPLNNYNTDADGLHTVLIEDTYEQTKFFGADILNEKTQELSVGQWVGPIELGSMVYWIKLMDIKQETISLYDAQLMIQRNLTAERRQEAYEQYLEGLNERARVTSRDEVLMRLLEIAEERYGPQG